ncbi:MAG: GNAT family N-acetyltransferase [Candidatus Devosia symbiotica]|nr:GNAT family N-acetyltransferase [Candidatus Devosia symbiotica]
MADGTAVSFAEASIRHDHINGCDTSPVGFVEGIYVAPEHRRNGLARKLVALIEDWARALGCSECASDAVLDNIAIASHRLHIALCFDETDRVVYIPQIVGLATAGAAETGQVKGHRSRDTGRDLRLSRLPAGRHS